MRLDELMKRAGLADLVGSSPRVLADRLRAAGAIRTEADGSGFACDYTDRDLEVVQVYALMRSEGWCDPGGSYPRGQAWDAVQYRVCRWVAEHGWPDEPSEIPNGASTIWLIGRSEATRPG